MVWVPPVLPRRRLGGTGDSLLCPRGWREGLWALERGRGVGTVPPPPLSGTKILRGRLTAGVEREMEDYSGGNGLGGNKDNES